MGCYVTPQIRTQLIERARNCLGFVDGEYKNMPERSKKAWIVARLAVFLEANVSPMSDLEVRLVESVVDDCWDDMNGKGQ